VPVTLKLTEFLQLIPMQLLTRTSLYFELMHFELLKFKYKLQHIRLANLKYSSTYKLVPN